MYGFFHTEKEREREREREIERERGREKKKEEQGGDDCSHVHHDMTRYHKEIETTSIHTI